MNNTRHRNFVIKSLLMPVNRVLRKKKKKKRNIFQCFNVPFINDDLLLGDGGGWEETQTDVLE